MAGHSKWANIKHKKERADKKKGKIFSRIAKEIISAVKQGGPDPKANAKLKLVLQKAKAANMPNEIIERNLKKAASQDQADFFELTYELYGYGGVGLILDIMTDTKNRIASAIRIATNKCGGTLANPGSVAFNCDRKGVIYIKKERTTEEDLFMIITDAGAEDLSFEEENFVVITPPDLLAQVTEAIQKEGIEVNESTLEMIPKTFVECSEEDIQSNMKLIEWLENLEDVDAVYHNIKRG